MASQEYTLTRRRALSLRRQNYRLAQSERSVPPPPSAHPPHHHAPKHGGALGKELEKAVEKLKEQLLRNQAEFENYRKRVRREQQQQIETASQGLLERLLPVLDNFERAVAAPGESITAFHDGIRMIQRQLTDLLLQEGLEPIEALGQPFDPKCHEAVAVGAAPDLPDNQILDVLQPGYQLKGRLLRPAMVRVVRNG